MHIHNILKYDTAGQKYDTLITKILSLLHTTTFKDNILRYYFINIIITNL